MTCLVHGIRGGSLVARIARVPVPLWCVTDSQEIVSAGMDTLARKYMCLAWKFRDNPFTQTTPSRLPTQVTALRSFSFLPTSPRHYPLMGAFILTNLNLDSSIEK